MECIFCKIAKGDLKSYTIYEDEMVKAYLDIHPDTNGHTLIIPKKHYRDLDDIDEKTITHIMMVAKKLKKMMEEKLGMDGLTLIQNNGRPQEVKHFHLHLKPTYEKNGRRAKIENVYDKIMKDED